MRPQCQEESQSRHGRDKENPEPAGKARSTNDHLLDWLKIPRCLRHRAPSAVHGITERSF